MIDPTLSRAPGTLRLAWSDAPADYPLIWLRDNAPEAFHPSTRERVQDLLALPDAPDLRGASISDGRLILDWSDAARTIFTLEWLAAHRPGRAAADPAEIAFAPWQAGFAPPRHDGAALMRDDGALRDWLRDLKATGLTIVDGLPDDPEAGRKIAERVGFLRRTNFGTTFEVVSKPDPNNLAYTAEALPLHTDLPNQEVPPGYQFLHCLANDAEGGGSTFADGVALAEALRLDDAAAFEHLATVPIPFRFCDGATDLRVRRPVIRLGSTGEIREIRWNAHIADAFDMTPEVLAEYYPAYRAYMRLTRAPCFRVETKLAAGEMVCFDNRRVLHGRGAFDPSTGRRHLRGCYVDRGEVDSRLRTLG